MRCCDKPKSVCADVVCTHVLNAWDSCIGPGELNVQGDAKISKYVVSGQEKGGNMHIEGDLKVDGSFTSRGFRNTG